MREHPRTEQSLHDFPPRSVLIGISSSFDLDARLDEFLIIIGKPLGT
jgi:hypothetical protein